MIVATVYIESSEGQIEKLTKSFDSKLNLATWLTGIISRYSYKFLLIQN